ncbi:MAG: aryl-sulfate sulfotransferase [Crocinitomicaceae bacterium]|nr:aryl-sulfate sulfotransferase [Crocinitomicaceae bacterium]
MKNALNLGLASLLSLFLVQTANAQSFNGYALYNLQNQNTTYLIDKDGNIAHSWSCSQSCNYTVLLKDNGNIMRGGVYGSNSLNGAAIGGMVQEIDPTGNVVWEYIYSNSDHCSHHDLTLLPNGNVILTAWEVMSTAELTQAGVNSPSVEQWPTHFIEIQQDGTGGQIVWEWHIQDHFIQDHDASKDNYGVIADHPELMDVNLLTVSGGGGGPGGGGGDWFHVNGVDYNSTLDQLVFSSRHLSEFIVIDHSTTTAEAASHSGGNSGMGGDFIYRWGNPSNYGSNGTQTIAAAVHDPRWIPDGRPNAGYIQYFNNEGGSGGNSAVDAIQAPENGFMYTMSGTSYGPSNYAWRHDCLANSTGQSASDRMSNGNTFVNVSGEYMYEVDASDNMVWQYSAGPTKAFRYECDHAGVIALLGSDPCGLNALSEETLANIQFYPNPSSDGIYKIDGVDIYGNKLITTVVNMYGQVVLEIENSEFIDLSNMPDGVYFAKLLFDGETSITKKLTLVR